MNRISIILPALYGGAGFYYRGLGFWMRLLQRPSTLFQIDLDGVPGRHTTRCR